MPAGGGSTDTCGDPQGAGCVVTGRLSRLNIGNPAAWPLHEADEQVLVTDWFQQFPSHSIGSVVFGPDGALYASGGDGASFDYVDYGQTARVRRPAIRRTKADRCAARTCGPAATR